MTGSDQQPKRKANWQIRSLLVVIALLVFVVVSLMMPRYQSNIATVDDAHQWPTASAPPRREIIWQPAIAVGLTPQEPANESHIRPQVADQGSTLYFTLRTTSDVNSNLNIVRSRRTVDGWSDPEPVDVLNSDADDIGPVFSKDEQTLYFYSGRAGGFGGMDLYVSKHDGNSWTDPVNMGSHVNSPADEYDPAIGPDSQRLYFSSNRSKQMQFDLLAGKTDEVIRSWQTTLRSDPSSRTFDLYTANWNDESENWDRATEMAWLNTRGNDEGSAFVSPDGAFLYFASDRSARNGEVANFDLYRWRINRRDLAPENLGLGVNTAENEVEPSLSDAGFKLTFSRSDQQSSNQYALYQSTATEIYHDGRWKESEFGITTAIRNFLSRYWLLLALIAALIAIVWAILQIRMRDVAIPGFLLLALLIHFLLVTGSFFIFFQQQIAQKMREVFFEEEVVATQMLSSNLPTSAEPTFDDVAKLELPQPIEPAILSREEFVPQATVQPIELAPPQVLPQRIAAIAAPSQDRIIASLPVEVLRQQNDSPLRRSTVRSDVSVERIEIERTVAADVQPIDPLLREPSYIERQSIETIEAPIKVADVGFDPQQPTLTNDSEIAEPVDTTQIKIVAAPIPHKLQRAPLEQRDVNAEIDVAADKEKVAAVEVQKVVSPQSQAVDIERNETMELPAVVQAEPVQLVAEKPKASLQPAKEALDPIVELDRQASAIKVDPKSSPLVRSRPLRQSNQRISDDSPTANEAIKLAVEKSSSSMTGKPNVDMAKSNSADASFKIAAISIPAKNSNLTPPTNQAESIDPIATQLAIAESSALPNPLASAVQRRRSIRRSPMYADARVNMQNLLMRRKLDAETKLQVVEEFGGSDKTLEAIQRGLVWIEQHQEDDGHWGLNDFHKHCKDHKRCTGHGNTNSDTGGTGLALLPFLGDGNTHRDGPYKDNVARGIQWLLKHQKNDGNLFSGGEQNATMYSHAIATIALCECYSMTNDQSLREPSQRAIDFIIKGQDPKSGGWRYRPRQDGDTSVVGWQIMALKSGQMANLNVPEKAFTDSKRWLDSVAGNGKRLGQFAYQRGRFNPAMTAEGLLCLEYMDADRESETLIHGSNFLLNNLPRQGKENSYYWYYGTQTMFHFQGDHWKRWNAKIHPLLISTQKKEGQMAGTWDPRDQWEKGGGRIYSTSLRVLMLEVYYRHLPLYKVIQ